jgi:threonine/homoserine/homoserine lactone efflux protein
VVDGIWAFLAVTVALSISPGPDDVLVLRSALAGGARLGMVTVYVAVIPRFVPPGAPALQYSMLLCAVDIGIAVTWLVALTWLAHGAVKRRLGAPS